MSERATGFVREQAEKQCNCNERKGCECEGDGRGVDSTTKLATQGARKYQDGAAQDWAPLQASQTGEGGMRKTERDSERREMRCAWPRPRQRRGREAGHMAFDYLNRIARARDVPPARRDAAEGSIRPCSPTLLCKPCGLRQHESRAVNSKSAPFRSPPLVLSLPSPFFVFSSSFFF